MMRFNVRRASIGWESKPCEGAELQRVTWTVPASRVRLTGNKKAHEAETEAWVIELDDIMAFVGEHGEIVIGPSVYHEVDGEITIYDDYIE